MNLRKVSVSLLGKSKIIFDDANKIGLTDRGLTPQIQHQWKNRNKVKSNMLKRARKSLPLQKERKSSGNIEYEKRRKRKQSGCNVNLERKQKKSRLSVEKNIKNRKNHGQNQKISNDSLRYDGLERESKSNSEMCSKYSTQERPLSEGDDKPTFIDSRSENSVKIIQVEDEKSEISTNKIDTRPKQHDIEKKKEIFDKSIVNGTPDSINMTLFCAETQSNMSNERNETLKAESDEKENDLNSSKQLKDQTLLTEKVINNNEYETDCQPIGSSITTLSTDKSSINTEDQIQSEQNQSPRSIHYSIKARTAVTTPPDLPRQYESPKTRLNHLKRGEKEGVELFCLFSNSHNVPSSYTRSKRELNLIHFAYLAGYQCGQEKIHSRSKSDHVETENLHGVDAPYDCYERKSKSPKIEMMLDKMKQIPWVAVKANYNAMSKALQKIPHHVEQIAREIIKINTRNPLYSSINEEDSHGSSLLSEISDLERSLEPSIPLNIERFGEYIQNLSLIQHWQDKRLDPMISCRNLPDPSLMNDNGDDKYSQEDSTIVAIGEACLDGECILIAEATGAAETSSGSNVVDNDYRILSSLLIDSPKEKGN